MKRAVLFRWLPCALGIATLAAGCTEDAASAGQLRKGSTKGTESGALADAGVSVHGKVSGTGGSLNVREKPTSSAAVIATLSEGADVVITCRAQGESVNGNASWDFIASESGYVADAYIATDSGAAIPACASASTDESAETVQIQGPPVQPQAQFFADEACRAVQACRASTYAGHEPRADLALDFNISEAFGKLPTDNYAFGDRVADFAISDMPRYRIDYVIYRQRINDGSGWQPMEDRGSITENHMDHVHVSFKP
jgi:hypothetical protein